MLKEGGPITLTLKKLSLSRSLKLSILCYIMHDLSVRRERYFRAALQVAEDVAGRAISNMHKVVVADGI